MNTALLGVFIFVFSLFVLELFFYTYRSLRYPDRHEMRKRLRTLVYEDEEGVTALLKKKSFSDVPILNQILQRIPGLGHLDTMIKQANLKHTLGFFFLCSMLLGLIGYMMGAAGNGSFLVAILTASGLACLPYFYVRLKRKKRMDRFEKQLPDALGLIARALRAGHSFTSGMQLAADEFEDPLGPEFENTLDEINFGVNVPDALKNLARRLSCPDLKFFVVAVILQRETGGNLAEIIENLGRLMRERFKFRGKVRVLTAEGRISAGVLVAIPFLLFGLLYLTNRSYIDVLLVNEIGKAMVGIAAVAMVLGILIIRRIITVDV